jgi:hypothetical protein
MIVRRQAARPNAAQNPAYRLIRHLFNNLPVFVFRPSFGSNTGNYLSAVSTVDPEIFVGR